MSRSMQVQHFTHIHPLTKVDGYGEFMCGGCKTYGFGNTYGCALCDYNLHDHCATCPPTLLSFMHPQHQLRLVFKRPEQTHQNKRMCNICDESAEGLYYQCEPCDFDVHPICTQLPQHVRHVPHSAHLLELSHWGASNTCMVCHGTIRSWRYKCGPCRLDVHMECVHSSASAAATTTQQRSFGPQQQFYHQPYYNQGYNYGYTNQGYNYGYTNQGYNYGYTDQGNNYGYTNQGQVQESGPSIGRRMFSILMALTVGVVCNIIASPASEALSACF